MKQDKLIQIIKEELKLEQKARLANRGRPPKKLAQAIAHINSLPMNDIDNIDNDDIDNDDINPEPAHQAEKDVRPAHQLASQQVQQQQQQEPKKYKFQEPASPEYKHDGFNFEEYMKLPTPGERLRYAAKNATGSGRDKFEKLGTGSSRVVYRMPGTGKVLKLALNEAGIDQNREELEITGMVHKASPEYPIVTKIFGHDSSLDPTWLIAEAVKGFKYRGEIEEATDMDFNDILVIAENGLSPEERKNATPFMKGLDVIAKLGFYSLDLDFPDHWGMTEDGRVVILDYGYTDTVADQYDIARRNRNSPYFTKFSEAYKQELK